MDRRQLKTQEAIFSAFTNLLSKNNYSNITVQNIINEANIGRSTFYSHFETKDDLLKALCHRLFSHVFFEDLDMENTHDFSLGEYTVQDMITHMLYHLKDSKKDILILLSSENNNFFTHYFKNYLNDMIKEYIIPKIEMDKVIPTDFFINHISSSFMGMVQWWIKNNLSTSPEDLSSYFFNSTFLSIKQKQC